MILESNDFDEAVSPQERAAALKLIGIDAKDKEKTLEEKLAIKYDNSAMLGGDKKLTSSDRIRTLFQQQAFSPLTRLVRLVKIEEAKMECYNRAIEYNLDPKHLKALPQPDKKFYASLLVQLLKFEIPELKAVELKGEVSLGMIVQLVQHKAQQKVIRVDAASPEHLRKMFKDDGKVLEVKTAPIPVLAELEDI